MLSQTEKAKQVRKYYLSIEKLINRYREIIEERMYKQIGILKYNQKPKTKIIGGVIYILPAQNVGGEELSLYKLGKAEDIKKRLNTYNSGNANDIEPLFIIKVNDIAAVEECAKILIKKFRYRKKKEIYQVDLDFLKIIITTCDALSDAIAKYYESGDRKEIDSKFKMLIKNKNKKMFFMFQRDL